jgi:hypothetical protein
VLALDRLRLRWEKIRGLSGFRNEMTGTSDVPVIYKEEKRLRRGGMRHGSMRKRIAAMPHPIRNKPV